MCCLTATIHRGVSADDIWMSAHQFCRGKQHIKIVSCREVTRCSQIRIRESQRSIDGLTKRVAVN